MTIVSEGDVKTYPVITSKLTWPFGHSKFRTSLQNKKWDKVDQKCKLKIKKKITFGASKADGH